MLYAERLDRSYTSTSALRFALPCVNMVVPVHDYVADLVLKVSTSLRVTRKRLA